MSTTATRARETAFIRKRDFAVVIRLLDVFGASEISGPYH